MSSSNRRKQRSSDAAVLKQIENKIEIIQEIIIQKNGALFVPWIKPGASVFVVALWNEFDKGRPFPITALSGNIYCG